MPLSQVAPDLARAAYHASRYEYMRCSSPLRLSLAPQAKLMIYQGCLAKALAA